MYGAITEMIIIYFFKFTVRSVAAGGQNIWGGGQQTDLASSLALQHPPTALNQSSDPLALHTPPPDASIGGDPLALPPPPHNGFT